MWTFLKPLLPRSGKGWGRTWGGGGRGATCVNCRLLPLRTVSSHSLLQTDKRGRRDLTPIVNWELIICSLPIHTNEYTKDKEQKQTKRETKTKTKTTMVFLSSDTSSRKKGKAHQESCENFRKQKRRRITTELTNLKFLC